jgi:hypothetical protein
MNGVHPFYCLLLLDGLPQFAEMHFQLIELRAIQRQ